MEIFTFESLDEYEKAMLRRYKSDPNFINNKSGILKIACGPKGAFFRNTRQKMIGVKADGEILCQCVLIKHRNAEILTVSFFEAAENAASAVGLMMARAESYARDMGAKRLVVALDGHCNYSVGFSGCAFSGPPLFGESYNPVYYSSYFQTGYRELRLSSYSGDFGDIYDKAEVLAARIEKRKTGVQTRCADMSRFRTEIARYTDLSNEIFREHWYYFHREYDEDYELFRLMKPLLTPFSLIFAVKDGIDIGYILLYPDFNQLVAAGGEAGIRTFLKHKLLRGCPDVVKIAEIAVLPEYRATGAIVTLFAESCRQIRRRFPQMKRVVSSWIANENTDSLNITKRFAPDLHGSYAAYEKEI